MELRVEGEALGLKEKLWSLIIIIIIIIIIRNSYIAPNPT